ncbi:MAG: DNA repair and recombination protein RadB [Nanoarchaeota archaeon]|nr:DNA repair and recombination protein RadB [Nanoarchaeota archaeon]MBU1322073.1 DNA repair and recombination protein RadB [Nanoarchaeota archaeon]MBU1598179.1 DNA repair and recombination protein RadB [Nanoarchaeota archaeon]MBU2441309.1 DNA repair and recombination protein RadB [Nanoarchaeota archaeon]
METKINSGTAEMDWLLEGGYDKGIITTIYGPGSSGKTNLLLLCIANSVKGQKVIYIDTEGSFSLNRYKQICPDFKKALEKIIFLKPTSFKEQEKAIGHLSVLIKQDVGAIFVDSITMLYRAELKEEMNRGLNNSLAFQVRTLLEIARKKDIPVIMTTQVYADFENKDQVKLVGGNIIKNMSKCLIELKKSGPNRVAIIQKHRSIEEGKSIMFRIIDEGIKEVKKEETNKENKN